jgi:hypothetical protein
MRSLVALVVLAACESKAPAPATTRAPLVDIDASLAVVRTAFNAHKGEARFLTLLSPT